MHVAKWFFALLLIFGVAGGLAAQTPDIEGGEIFASGFNGPQGILVDPEGNVWVIEAGMGGDEEINFVAPGNPEPAPSPIGDTSRIIMITPDGEQTEVAALPSVFAAQIEFIGGGRLALHDGVLYATNGQWIEGVTTERYRMMASIVRIENGEGVEIANTWAYEEANNPDGTIRDSHPYGITPGPDGWLWVADAGGNALLRVDPASGTIETVTAFAGLPGVFPNPFRNDAMEADPVPTAVVFDEDGNAYVSLLSGAPFIPGSAKVLKITPDGEISDYAVGLTMLTDLRRGPDGELYAVQFGLFTEEGPVPDAGAVVRIKEGEGSEVVLESLPFPTSLDFDSDGNAYITINGVGAPGSGAVLKVEALTAAEGEPIVTGS